MNPQQAQTILDYIQYMRNITDCDIYFGEGQPPEPYQVYEDKDILESLEHILLVCSNHALVSELSSEELSLYNKLER